MSYTISQLKDGITRELHGRTTDRVQDVYETAYEAAQILQSELDLKETQREVQITPQLFDDVYAYSCPEDFKTAIDLLPSGGRKPGFEYEDDFRNTSQREFSQRASFEAPIMSEKWVNGTRFLLLRKYPRLGQVVKLDSFDNAASWTIDSGAQNLETNTLNFLEGSASTSMELIGASEEFAIFKTVEVQDLSAFKQLGAWFIKVYIPSGFSSRFTQFTISHTNSGSGSDWSKDVTANHDGTAFHDGWNILRFDWSSATEDGSVDETIMDYVVFSGNFSAGVNIPGFLVDDLSIQLGSMYDLNYYSSFLFRSALGVWKEKPTSDEDIVNLSTDAYFIFKDICAMLAMSEISSMEKDYEKIKERLGYPTTERDPFKGSIGGYRRKYPSQQLPKTTITRDYGV